MVLCRMNAAIFGKLNYAASLKSGSDMLSVSEYCEKPDVTLCWHPSSQKQARVDLFFFFFA